MREKNMMQTKWSLQAAIVSTILLAFTLPTTAEEGTKSLQTETREMQLLKDARVGLAEAIRIAEAKARGNAVKSGIERENGNVSYEIEVMAADGKLTDVFIDPHSGNIIKTAAADSDEDENEDQETSKENTEQDGEDD
jgi:uncharacterized membrane protein YkoI